MGVIVGTVPVPGTTIFIFFTPKPDNSAIRKTSVLLLPSKCASQMTACEFVAGVAKPKFARFTRTIVGFFGNSWTV